MCIRDRGRAVVRLRMEPSSVIIAQLVEPLFFLAEKDGDEDRRDPQEFAESAAIDRRADNRKKENERHDSRRGRHEYRAARQADGGSGSGAVTSSRFPRTRRIAQASGS